MFYYTVDTYAYLLFARSLVILGKKHVFVKLTLYLNLKMMSPFKIVQKCVQNKDNIGQDTFLLDLSTLTVNPRKSKTQFADELFWWVYLTILLGWR